MRGRGFADPSKKTRTLRVVLAFVVLFTVSFAASTAITTSFSAGELSGMPLTAFVAAAGATFIGWLTLMVFSYSAAFRGRRPVPLAIVSLAAALVGGAACILALTASVLIGHNFAGPILALQLVWSFALGVLGFLALAGSR
ncbi:hypothetical protein UG56_023020 [Nocardioides luteus]|uniref:Transmembrane protein n=1 Tax=Nocardioides luteus TaxID=1844 RepID=A0A1J4N1V6_9ACTN|nr:hypothetical protein UG56_023020 [Nocardioides luteus]